MAVCAGLLGGPTTGRAPRPTRCAVQVIAPERGGTLSARPAAAAAMRLVRSEAQWWVTPGLSQGESGAAAYEIADQRAAALRVVEEGGMASGDYLDARLG